MRLPGWPLLALAPLLLAAAGEPFVSRHRYELSGDLVAIDRCAFGVSSVYIAAFCLVDEEVTRRLVRQWTAVPREIVAIRSFRDSEGGGKYLGVLTDKSVMVYRYTYPPDDDGVTIHPYFGRSAKRGQDFFSLEALCNRDTIKIRSNKGYVYYRITGLDDNRLVEMSEEELAQRSSQCTSDVEEDTTMSPYDVESDMINHIVTFTWRGRHGTETEFGKDGVSDL